MNTGGMNRRINQTIQLIVDILHKGILYANYAFLYIAVVCIINKIIIENAMDLSLLDGITLKDSIELCVIFCILIIPPICVLFFITSQLTLDKDIDDSGKTFLNKIIFFILYSFFNLLLMDVLQIETVTDYFIVLIPTGFLIIILLSAIILGVRLMIDKRTNKKNK